MQNINLSMTPYTQAGNFVCSQYDVGRQCQIQLVDDNGEYTIPTGATVTIQATKPSGLGFSVECTWSGSTVTFATTETMTNEFGRFPAELRITSGTTILGTTNFYFKVERSPHPNGTTDGDTEEIIPEITVLVERAEAAAQTAAEDAAAAAQETIDEILDTIPQDIADLKDDLDKINNAALMPVPLIFESATGYWGNNGTFYTYGGVTVAKVSVSEGQTYFLTSKSYYNCARAVALDANGNYVGSLWTSGDQELHEMTPFEIPENGVLMLIQNCYSTQQPYELYISDVAEVIKDAIEVKDLTTEDATVDVSLTFDSATGYYGNNKTFYTYSGVTTATVAVTEGERYYLTGRNYYNSALACLLDSNDTVKSVVFIESNEKAVVNVPIDIPTGITSLLIQRISGFSPTLLKKANGLKNVGVKSILNGKQITLIGDSITQYNYRAAKNWAIYLTEWTGAAVVNRGIGGSGFANTEQRYITRIPYVGAPDIIGVAVSFNDMATNLPVGTVSDTGTASLAGYANDFFDALIAAYPTTPIICYVQSPWDGYHYGVAKSDAWIDMITQICGKNGIPFYGDMYRGCTLKPWLEASRTLYYTSDNEELGNVGTVDGVHPNSVGHKVIARYLYPKFAENIVDVGMDYK